MNDPVLASKYARESPSRVWASPGYCGIPYSDGDEPEERMAEIMAKAKDLSPLSAELALHCTDWPSRYHLSSARANILRPFAASLGGDVLEIGAGCGALTRYLGECGGRVIALEGSRRRAAIAASRTRDLPNVAVLAEDFGQFESPSLFDVITLVGVLEYANLFVHADNPPLAMLQRARSFLKPDGVLILAIENQLGLKYFAGAGEDHIGTPMYGIEGRYRSDQPQTFGRGVLVDMLHQAGFGTTEFLLPFPDYKLPASVLTQSGLNSRDFDAAALARQTASRDPQLPAYCNFLLELAWPTVFDNGLAPDLSNSFLVAASPSARQLIDPRILAFHYSTSRQAKYCKESLFYRAEAGPIQVRHKRLGQPAVTPAVADPFLQFHCPETTDYTFGSPLSLDFIRMVTTDGWKIIQVAMFIRRYLEILQSLVRKRGGSIDMCSPYSTLSGEFLDAIPQNLIVHPNGTVTLIDEEWTLREPVELGYLLFRAMMSQMWMVRQFGISGEGRPFTHGSFLTSALGAAGLQLTRHDIQRYIEMEARLHNHVVGYSSYRHADADTWIECALQTQPLRLALAAQLAQRDEELARGTARERALEGSLAAWHNSLFGRLSRVADSGWELARLPFRAGHYLVHPDLRTRAINSLGRKWRGRWGGRNISELPELDWLLRKLEVEVPVDQVTARLGAYLTARDEAGYRSMIGSLKAVGTGMPSTVQRALSLRPVTETPLSRHRLLFVCGEFPNPVHGGGGRVADFIKALSAHHDVLVAAWYDRRRDHAALVELAPYCRGFLGLTFEDLEGGCSGKLMQLLGGQPADIVHYEWPRSLISLDRQLGRHHIYTHMESVSCSLWMDLKRLEPLSRDWLIRLAQLLTMLGVETLDAGRTDAQVVVTAKDGDFLSRFVAGQTYYVVNHGINRDEFDVPDQAAQPNTLVFTGNFVHYPNVDAVHYFMRDIHPLILAAVPDVRVWLVGANPPREIQRYHDGHRIMVTGHVPDVRPYIQKATLCVAPLISGAGLRTKVVQYAALRRPCVATPIAVEDLAFEDGREICLATGAVQFAARVVELLRDPIRAAAMAEQARKKALACYDNRLIAEQGLGQLYHMLDAGKEPS